MVENIGKIANRPNFIGRFFNERRRKAIAIGVGTGELGSLAVAAATHNEGLAIASVTILYVLFWSKIALSGPDETKVRELSAYDSAVPKNSTTV